jgi:hypothetical protein
MLYATIATFITMITASTMVALFATFAASRRNNREANFYLVTIQNETESDSSSDTVSWVR